MNNGNNENGRTKKPVITIPAKPRERISRSARALRVAGYCRVSSKKEEQEISFKLQKDYFDEMIRQCPSWSLVKIYADHGISGTQLKNRDEFNQMIRDAKAGKIDLILTKSVSRFARNTVDLLQTVRDLLALPNPVHILFETENISTEDGDYDMKLSFHGIFAQAESKNKSDSMLWSIIRRFTNGQFLTPSLYGYFKEEKMPLTINEEEAKIVRLMFALLLDGWSTQDIADELNKMQVQTKTGLFRWTGGGIGALLRNERLCGDILARKTFTDDVLTHRSKKNRGEVPFHTQEDHHDPIVPREIYKYARRILSARRYRVSQVPTALTVVGDGALKGFVSVNRGMVDLTYGDFLDASDSVYTGDHDEITAQDGISFDITKLSGVDLNGYQTVDSSLFSSYGRAACSMTKDKISFSTECVRRLSGTEYIELLFHPRELLFAIRPCGEDNMNAIKWASVSNRKISTWPKGIAPFANILFERLGWNTQLTYRFYGIRRSKNGEDVILFDLSEPELRIEEEDGDFVRRINVFNKKLADAYGNDFYENCASSGLYLTDILDLWNLQEACDLSEIERERAEKMTLLCKEYLREFERGHKE